MQANAETEAAVRTVLDRLADVYVTRDASAMASLFASDPDVSMFSPGAERVVRLETIQAKAVSDWARTDAATLAYGRMSVSAAGSVAWVATDADFTVSAGGQETMTPVRITFVLERRDGAWRIAHAHYSLAPAPTVSGVSRRGPSGKIALRSDVRAGTPPTEADRGTEQPADLRHAT